MKSDLKKFKIKQMVHISSSVVESIADDFYTKTKIEQEKIVVDSGIICPILRPTLMFGWFDRKHLGWLSRFMRKVPVFPILCLKFHRKDCSCLKLLLPEKFLYSHRFADV